MLIVFTAGWLAGSACTTGKRADDEQQAAAVLASTFTAARTRCDPQKTGTSIADAGRTLTVDGKGTDLLNGVGLEFDGLTCLLDALQPRACTNAICDCHIGYVHLTSLRLRDVYAGGVLERIPAVWPPTGSSGSPSSPI
ncbi:hypothetical protein [Actinoplanes sp. NPDC023714]|uniref:hypothetical protein n=1 Tax=Actinoplanes sp. NPDC023714 TaxID=3154322 RepID=UPI0033FC792E